VTFRFANGSGASSDEDEDKGDLLERRSSHISSKGTDTITLKLEEGRLSHTRELMEFVLREVETGVGALVNHQSEKKRSNVRIRAMRS
jgi:hypothetical protein